LPAPGERFTHEWVELYNPGPNAIDLSGWIIDDEHNGNGHTLPGGSVIAAGEFLLVELERAIFNNDGDEVRLIEPGGNPIDQMRYTSANPDVGFARHPGDGSWYQTDALSPREPNLVPKPDPVNVQTVAPTNGAVLTTTGPEHAVPPNPELSSHPTENPATSIRPAIPDWLQTHAITAQPAYSSDQPGIRYAYAAPTAAISALTPAVAPTDAVSDDTQSVMPNPIWIAAALMVIAGALFVSERKPTAPESETEPML
jgi:hypothetical protein